MMHACGHVVALWQEFAHRNGGKGVESALIQRIFWWLPDGRGAGERAIGRRGLSCGRETGSAGVAMAAYDIWQIRQGVGNERGGGAVGQRRQ